MSLLAVRVYATDGGEGKARLTSAFAAENPLFRLDVLQDAIRQLEQVYDLTLAEWELDLREMGAEFRKAAQ